MPIMFRPSVRQRAFAAAAVTLLSLTPASYSFGQDIRATPVASTTNDGITATTDCKAWKPGELMADEKCEILKGEFLRAQGKALDAQGKQLDAQNRCIGELVKFKTAYPDKAKEFAKMVGPVTRENACEVAGKLPRPSASAAPNVGG